MKQVQSICKFKEEIGIQENDKKVDVLNVKKAKEKEVKEIKVKGKGARKKRISQKKFSNTEGGKDVPEILENPKEPFEDEVGSGEDSSDCSETSASEISSSSNFSEQSVLELESGEEDSIQSGGMSSINQYRNYQIKISLGYNNQPYKYPRNLCIWVSQQIYFITYLRLSHTTVYFVSRSLENELPKEAILSI